MNHRDPDAAQTPLISCVEDDASVREALGGLLQAFGFRVATFSCAEALLSDERLQSTACLIIDVKLGGMSGLQLQKTLAASGYEIPVIIMTAFSGGDIPAQAMGAGALDVLIKPIKTERLLAAVEAALGGEPLP